MTMYRQGDVLIIAYDRIKADGKKRVPREGGRVVLAHGEATGHAHAISSRYCSLYADDNLPGGMAADRVLIVSRTVTLSHEEHAPIKLPPGAYIIRRQREYSPEELRNVAD